jgi:hypothetical protein
MSRVAADKLQGSTEAEFTGPKEHKLPAKHHPRSEPGVCPRRVREPESWKKEPIYIAAVAGYLLAKWTALSDS